MKKIKLTSLVLFLALLMGCSVTSLRCGTDGDSSFVNLNTNQETLSQNSREMASLCAFAYQESK